MSKILFVPAAALFMVASPVFGVVWCVLHLVNVVRNGAYTKFLCELTGLNRGE